MQRQRNISLLSSLPEPKQVYNFFLQCTEIPRKSSELEGITMFLKQFAEERGLYFDTDFAQNCVIRKPASPGYEDVPSVALQAHMDMVCSSIDGKFDFSNSPIDCVVEGNLLTAEGTTLGADNGMGIAAMLAVLDDKELAFGPIECLFTYDEETTMSGAEFLAPAPFLVSNVLINLDSEEENSICLGCSGGFETKLHFSYSTSGVESGIMLNVEISGLVGGHTGVDINRGRGNAIKLIGRLLQQANCRLVSIQGGTAKNSIPRSCVAQIVVEVEEVTPITKLLNTRFSEIAEELSEIEADIKLSIETVDTLPQTAYTTIDSIAIFDVISISPNGPLRMSPAFPEAVSTSISLSVIDTEEDISKLYLHFFCRSDCATAQNHVRLSLESLSRITNMTMTDPFNAYPGWTPDTETSIFQKLKTAYSTLNLYEDDPRVYAIHAGLECGLIKGKYPSMECVSIGPLITNAHTPDESLHLDTVEPFYLVLLETLRSFSEEHK